MTILPPSMKAALLFFLPLAVTLASAHAEDGSVTNSITSLTRAAPGKLATQTEIVAERGEPAMVTPSSLRAMDSAIAMYEDINGRGGWPTLAKRLQKGDRSDEVVMLRQRLANEGYLPTESLAIEAPQKFDSDVKEAVKAFQSNHGLAATGKIDDRTLAELNIPASVRLETLRTNRPRIAAFAEGLGPRYILVNIPSAQLEAVNFGSVYSRHNVVAGKIDRPSPALVSRVSEINFPNPYNVYLHDTPAKELFGRNARYVSSGCIRVDQIHVLIDWIFAGQDGYDSGMIKNIALSGERFDQPVGNPPDVRIMYLTAWATDDGRIQFRPDVYNLDHAGFVLGQPEPQSAMN